MSDTLQSVLTALRVLEAVGSEQPVAVGDLARLVERPKSTVQRALATLHEAGWIRPDGSDRTRWVLTSRVATLVRHLGNDSGLRDVATPVLVSLRNRTRESTSLLLHDGDTVTIVDHLEGLHPVRLVASVGSRVPLHTGAAGKALLAALSSADAERFLAAPLERFTHHTRDASSLREELVTIRARGYAISLGEYTEDAASAAAPIRGADGRALGAVSVLLPASRMSAERAVELGAAVAEAAAAIERGLIDRCGAPGEVRADGAA